jgi:hypothetical protein
MNVSVDDLEAVADALTNSLRQAGDNGQTS